MPDQAVPPTNRERPLSDKELIEIREVLEGNRRAKWLGAWIRTIAIWVTAVLAAATILIDSMASGIKSLIGKG